MKINNSFRIITVGSKSSIGYVSKYYLDLINNHPDYSSSSMLMNTLLSGVNDITQESGISISSQLSDTVSLITYFNLTLTFSQSSTDSYTSDLYYDTNDFLLNVIENSYIEVTPGLTWSSSGSTVIVYSITNYGSFTAPTWILL